MFHLYSKPDGTFAHKVSDMPIFELDKKICLFDISVSLASEMIKNQYFLFVSRRDHNSPTILNSQLNKIACNLLEVQTKCQLLQSVYMF